MGYAYTLSQGEVEVPVWWVWNELWQAYGFDWLVYDTEGELLCLSLL